MLGNLRGQMVKSFGFVSNLHPHIHHSNCKLSLSTQLNKLDNTKRLYWLGKSLRTKVECLRATIDIMQCSTILQLILQRYYRQFHCCGMKTCTKYIFT